MFTKQKYEFVQKTLSYFQSNINWSILCIYFFRLSFGFWFDVNNTTQVCTVCPIQFQDTSRVKFKPERVYIIRRRLDKKSINCHYSILTVTHIVAQRRPLETSFEHYLVYCNIVFKRLCEQLG